MRVLCVAAASIGSACEDLQDTFLALRDNYREIETEFDCASLTKLKWSGIGIDTDDDEQIMRLVCNLIGMYNSVIDYCILVAL